MIVRDVEALPTWVTWQRRPFPDANVPLLRGRQPALVDTGVVGNAEETAAWARAHTGHVELVVNTHWHSDHVGGNTLLQAMGAGIAASAPDAQAVARQVLPAAGRDRSHERGVGCDPHRSVKAGAAVHHLGDYS